MIDKKIFIFAGEPSGDLHGSRLLKELKQQHPSLQLSGVGGPLMRNEGLQCFLPMEEFEVMGFTDVILALPKLFGHFHRIKNYLLESKPDLIVLIDYPGFNLRLAKALRKKNFEGKIVHYISPSVWAHGKGRIEQMANTLNGLLTIFPFEAQHFSNTSLKVDYVGNPLKEYVKEYHYTEQWKEAHGINPELPLLSLFPGSRQGEITRNLPTMLQAVEMLKMKHGEVAVAISYANEEIKKNINEWVKQYSLNVHLVPRRFAYEMMKDSRMAIAKSGTVTLELALHKCPTVVVYQITGLNRLIAKAFLRLKLAHYCIVNILKGETVFPEFIEYGFSKENIFEKISLFHTHDSARLDCQKKCEEIEMALTDKKASKRAAEKILEHLSC